MIRKPSIEEISTQCSISSRIQKLGQNKNSFKRAPKFGHSEFGLSMKGELSIAKKFKSCKMAEKSIKLQKFCSVDFSNEEKFGVRGPHVDYKAPCFWSKAGVDTLEDLDVPDIEDELTETEAFSHKIQEENKRLKMEVSLSNFESKFTSSEDLDSEVLIPQKKMMESYVSSDFSVCSEKQEPDIQKKHKGALGLPKDRKPNFNDYYKLRMAQYSDYWKKLGVNYDRLE
jgi:hypothetical protein